jgi:hypothetical protein
MSDELPGIDQGAEVPPASVPSVAIGWVCGGTSGGGSGSVYSSSRTTGERHERRTTPGAGAACSIEGGRVVAFAAYSIARTTAPRFCPISIEFMQNRKVNMV